MNTPSPPPSQRRLEAVAALPAHPYRLLFPLGVLFTWVGVFPWTLPALGVSVGLPEGFHPLIQIQGFLLTLASGFLLTAVPRLTKTPLPPPGEVVGVAGLLGALVLAVGLGQAPLGEVFGLGAMGWLGIRTLQRLRAAPERDPLLAPALLQIPLALGVGLVGGLLWLGGGFGTLPSWAYDLGWLLLTQGMFLGLVLGLGGFVVPLMTRGEAPWALAGPAAVGVRSRRLFYQAVPPALLATFVLEVAGWPRTALVLRAGVCLVALVGILRVHRLPTLPGYHRWWIWLGPWCIPLGYLLAALLPATWIGALHLVFIGGFGLTAFGVAAHVVLGHEGDGLGQHTWSPGALGFGLLLGGSMIPRLLSHLDPSGAALWLGVAGGLWLAGTLVWTGYLLAWTRAHQAPSASDAPPGS